jgi:hypothetical protein
MTPTTHDNSPDALENDDVTWQAGTETGEETTGDDEIIAARTDIETTRAHMSETVDAIQEKLSPGNMVDDATSAVRDATIGKAQAAAGTVSDTARGWGSGALETIRQNPIPAALAGVGLGWLLVVSRRQTSSSSDSSYRPSWGTQGQVPDTASRIQDRAAQAQQRAGDVAGQMQDTVAGAAGQVQDTASRLAGQAQDQAAQLGAQAQYQARQAQSGFSSSCRISRWRLARRR